MPFGAALRIGQAQNPRNRDVQRTLDGLELPLSISVAHRIDLVSDLFRTFLEGTKPLFVRYQEPVARAAS
jgi:hypothetical protein